MSGALVSHTLHPVVEIKVGNRNFACPPQYLTEFEERIVNDGFARTVFKLTDPSYIDLEKSILDDSKSSGVVRYRWGYPGSSYADWKEFAPTFILPEITDRGYSLMIDGFSSVVASITQVEALTFKGKVSNVVKQCVDKLHAIMKAKGSVGIVKAYIEETADDENEGMEDALLTAAGFYDVPVLRGYRAPKAARVWTTGNRSLLRFISEDLRPIAVSKESGKTDYCFYIDSKGYFHFHTKEFEKGRIYDPTSGEFVEGKIPGVKYRTFRYLWGMPSGVISFRPVINSAIIGGHAKGWVVGTLDPKTKQYREQAVNRQTVKADDAHPRSLSGPPNEVDPSDTKIAEVFKHEPSSVELGPGVALARSTNQWKHLATLAMPATLELVGTPEYVRFTPEEQYCNVQVYLPNGGLHWTSGQYFIREVTHTIIGGRYSIKAELFRGTALDGPVASAKGK